MKVTNKASGEEVTVKLPIWGCLGCLGAGAAVTVGGGAMGIMVVSWCANAINALLN